MKIKSLVMLMAAATVLASCSKSEIEKPVTGEDGEITLRSTVIDVNTTRAAYEGSDLSAKPLKALVFASLSIGTYTNLHCYGTMNFNGSTTGTPYDKPVLGGDYKYPTNTATIYLTALHPSTGWTGVDTTTDPDVPKTTSGVVKTSLTGKEDVMMAPQVSTKLSDVTGGTYANLTFAHQLTLIKLFLSCDEKAKDKIKIKNIELTKANDADLKTEVTAKLTDPQSITFAAPTLTTSLSCYAKGTDNVYRFDSGSEYLVQETAVEQAYVLAPPVDASNADGTKEYTFSISYLDGTEAKTQLVEVDLKGMDGSTAFDGSTASNAFNITFKFVGGKIVANATVTDWTQGGAFEQEI